MLGFKDMLKRGDVFNSSRRINVLTVICLAMLAVLVVRLFDLQILRHSYYMALAESQRQRASELRPHRGTIYVSEGSAAGDVDTFPVATNKRGYIAYAVPRDMPNPREIAEQLAPALLAFQQRQVRRIDTILQATGQERAEQPPVVEKTSADIEREQQELTETLTRKFDQKRDPYEPLLKPYEILDDQLKSFFDDAKLAGIAVEEQEVRAYPESTLAAHVLGYVGYEEGGLSGRYGVEGFFEKELAGNLGFLSSERDTSGNIIGVGRREFKPAANGTDIVLTIDRVVQSIIEQELRDGVQRYGAERGSIIVMNPKTGAIVGQATFPTYDPNYYYAIREAGVQLNPVISDIFEPGSILKPLVMAAAMQENLVQPDTTMVDNGPVQVAKYKIDTFDGKHPGVLTMTQIIEQSNNVGMVWVGQKLGAETMYDYFRRFGLGEKTGIELEGETQTNLLEPQRWNVATTATSSFGQGVAVTALQALDAINVFANKGTLMRPYIVSRRIAADGQTTQTNSQAVRNVVSEATAGQVSGMMVSAIENGVAQLARVPGYYLAGKTGTAQVPDERGKYSANRKIISFVGFGPVEDPQFSILIKLDNPAGLSFASGTAAPMFRNISSKLLQYYQIPPSYDAAGPRQHYRAPTESGA